MQAEPVDPDPTTIRVAEVSPLHKFLEVLLATTLQPISVADVRVHGQGLGHHAIETTLPVAPFLSDDHFNNVGRHA